MVNQYSYLIGSLLFILIWLVFFLWRKDTRKEMLIISLLFGIAGLLSQIIYINDWWKPLTITATSLGIEDFLFGFSIGGISSVVYEHLFNKRVKIKKVKKLKEQKRNINFLLVIFTIPIIFYGGFFILGINTFISSIFAFVIPTSIIYLKRKDLIRDSFFSGIFTVLIMFLVYQIIELIIPGFFESFFLFQNIGHIIFLKIPLEEYIWFFLLGLLVGPLYEYWKEGKLINVKN